MFRLFENFASSFYLVVYERYALTPRLKFILWHTVNSEFDKLTFLLYSSIHLHQMANIERYIDRSFELMVLQAICLDL